jgi:hypothetical protein
MIAVILKNGMNYTPKNGPPMIYVANPDNTQCANLSRDFPLRPFSTGTISGIGPLAPNITARYTISLFD